MTKCVTEYCDTCECHVPVNPETGGVQACGLGDKEEYSFEDCPYDPDIQDYPEDYPDEDFTDVTDINDLFPDD